MGSGAHPTSYSIRTGDLEADDAPSSSGEIKNGGPVLPVRHISVWCGA
jgi:hypothetical protein